MLDINLLPENRRRTRRLSWKMIFILVIAGALLVCEVGLGLRWYRQHQRLQDDIAQLENTIADLESFEQEHQQLQDQIQPLQTHQEVIQQVQPSEVYNRYRWSHSVHQLFDVIQRSPGIWLVNMEGLHSSEMGGDRERNEGEDRDISHVLHIEVRSAGQSVEGMTQFKNRLIDEFQIREGDRVEFQELWRDMTRGEETDEEIGSQPYWEAQFRILFYKMGDDGTT